jgi:hypothetical protein
MNKASVIAKFHEIADHYMLGAGTWPAGRESLAAFWRVVRELGLEEDMPGSPGSVRSTALGQELNLELLMTFVGAYDLLEIPMTLESNGYLHEGEMDALWTMPEEQFEGILHHYVLRAYLKFCNHSKFLN